MNIREYNDVCVQIYSKKSPNFVQYFGKTFKDNFCYLIEYLIYMF